MASAGAVSLAVRVTPRGGRDAVDGWMRDASGRLLLKVRVSAAAADGAANASVLALIAKSLKIPRSAVSLAAGQTARVKRLELVGVDGAALLQAFGAVPPEP